MAAGSKAVIAIGIAVAIVLFLGPLGSLGPWLNDFINSFFRQGEDTTTSSEPEAGAETGSKDEDISKQEEGPSVGSPQEKASEKEPTDGEERVGEQAPEEPGSPEEAKGQEKDSDGDGISDEEEDEAGTDREKPDTDEDGVKDGDERDRGTDPRRRNTDGDRLDDGLDAEPTVKNNAFVRVIASKLSIEEDYTAMVGVILSPIVGNISPNTEASRVTIDLVFENIGNDFTSFIKFDGVFQVDGKEVKKTKTEIGRLNIGQKVTKHFAYTVKVSDIPPDVINKIVKHVVEGNHPVFSFEIKNIDFEKF